jgi:5,10-methylenetetrahydromethanopterin reductase
VQAAAVATLNRMAPGRIFLGIGTGNTALRSMGQRPMRIAGFDACLTVLAALLRGYVQLYRREILQADRGCDFNFLRKEPLGEAR